MRFLKPECGWKVTVSLGEMEAPSSTAVVQRPQGPLTQTLRSSAPSFLPEV